MWAKNMWERISHLINTMAPDPVEMAALRVISTNSIEKTATITLTLSFKLPVKYNFQKCCTTSSVISSAAEREVSIMGNQ